MAISFERTVYPAALNPFWRKEVKMLPGGFSMKQTFPIGDVIERGAYLFVDMLDMSAVVVKIGKVVDGGTAKKPRVSKKNNFVVGDTLMKLGKTDLSVTVVSIDRSNPSYDTVEVSANITGVAAGDFLQEASAYVAAAGSDDAVPAAPLYEVNAVLGADLEIKANRIHTIDASYDCIMLKQIAAPIPDTWLTGGYCLTNNHSIKFINQ